MPLLPSLATSLPALTALAASPSIGPADAPAACTDQTSYTCTWVYEMTGNATVANGATWLLGKPTAIVTLVLVGMVARWIAHRVIDRVVAGAAKGVRPSRLGRGTIGRARHDSAAAARHGQRVETLGSMLKSITTGVVFAVVIIMTIAELGYNVGPILAGAGIVGVAIGFGAQALVKDFLSGMFMMFEDQYGVGDTVDLGECDGVVEAVSLRVTRVRDVNGTVWYVRNGEILRVGNMSQNWARTVLDVPVAYDEDLDRVKAVLAEIAHDLWETEDHQGKIIEEPEVWGVQSLEPDSVLVRVVMKTTPGSQWLIAREMRERVKERFDAERIEIPLPQRVIWHRDETGASGDRHRTDGVAEAAGRPS